MTILNNTDHINIPGFNSEVPFNDLMEALVNGEKDETPLGFGKFIFDTIGNGSLFVLKFVREYGLGNARKAYYLYEKDGNGQKGHLAHVVIADSCTCDKAIITLTDLEPALGGDLIQYYGRPFPIEEGCTQSS